MRRIAELEAAAARRRDTLALAVGLAWMAVAFVLASLGAEAGLVAGQAAALIQWLVVGVLPPALAWWQLPDGD